MMLRDLAELSPNLFDHYFVHHCLLAIQAQLPSIGLESFIAKTCVSPVQLQKYLDHPPTGQSSEELKILDFSRHLLATNLKTLVAKCSK